MQVGEWDTIPIYLISELKSQGEKLNLPIEKQ